MATFLYRLGRFSFRRRQAVVAVWLALLVLFGIGAATLSEDTSDSLSIPGTQSQQAIDLLQERFPQAAADGATARVVIAAPDGQTLNDPGNQSAVEDVVSALGIAPEVVSVADPYETGAVSPDGTIAYAQVSYGVQAGELTEQARDALTEAVEPARDAGLQVEMGGDAVPAQPEQGGTEIIGIGIAAVVLVITFGSLLAAGLPLLTAILGVGIGISAITAASGFVDLSSSTPTLALMLGLAVAIDYALFIVSRYRHELAEGGDAEEAAGRAVGMAGSAVVFAGLTVIIALAGLSVVGIPILTEMGLAAAFTVGIAVLIALSLLPAMLGFARRRIVGGRIPGLRSGDPESDEGKPRMGERWARLVTRRPLAVLVTAVLAMVTLAIPALDLRLGLPDEGSMASDTTQRKAYDLLAEGFGPGFNGPLTVVVDVADASSPEAAAQQVADTLGTSQGVAAVTPAVFNPAGDTALLTVVPTTEPGSAETEDLVGAIREQSAGLESETGATTLVTGETAINVDFSEKVSAALLPYLALVVGLSFLLLLLVFRSILVPIKATLGFLLTMAATFGAVVAVFQWGWLADPIGVEQTGPVLSLLPIFLIGVVFGLAMDYQVFLVTRMREAHVHGEKPTPAVVHGFQRGARVVTAAAIIMISVFSGFIFSGEDLIKQIGFALAIAVAFDAFVVRMTIVPAVMTLLGERAWWLPRWLDRRLPNVDVEGERLRQVLDQPVERELETASRT